MELKRNFIAGIMNKDLDERFIPKGQFRDARNTHDGTSYTTSVRYPRRGTLTKYEEPI